MYKKFVSLNSNKSPSKNPYEVRTFLGEPLKPQHPEWQTKTCGYKRDCGNFAEPQLSTKAKVLTLEDEIRKIHKKTQENLFQKPFKKSCQYDDRFVACVVPQRTPFELKRNAKMREKFLKTKREMEEYVHDANDLYEDQENLIKLEDPFEGGSANEKKERQNVENSERDIIPEFASPECSMDYIYIPPQKLLELKRPKSGLFINESQKPNFYPSDEIPYSTYNPRALQEQFDAQYLKKIDVIPGKSEQDLWTWNVGIQKKESDLDREFIEAAVPEFDCDNLDLAVFKIPKDLDKTFSAGIVFGTKAVVPETPSRKKGHFNRPLEMACMYVAYVEGFRLNADFWNAATMDNIIKMGEKLKAKSEKINYKSPDNEFDIIPQIIERQAAIDIKVHFTGPLKSEPNIYKALTLYFSKYNAGVLWSNQMYLLIWKRCKNLFYIYDPNGRAENCQRDFAGGKCALMSTLFVEHLVHLVVNISGMSLEDEFSLYEIFLTSYGSITNPLPKEPFPKTFHKKWSVVNNDYAVIPGCNGGLFQPLKSTEDNASMLISLMAIFYSHIERANGWKPDQIDELIRLGTAYYKSLRRKLKLKDSKYVTITDLPDKYVLGTYKASLKKLPFMYTAILTDYCNKYQDSLLTSGLKELFTTVWESALLQIDNSVVAVWKDRDLFYVYDPFRRGRAGQILDPEDYRTNGTAILQMHANFDSLARMLYQNALKMRRGGKLFIHSINVGCIKPIMDGKFRKLRYPKLKLTPETYKKPKDEAEVNSEEEKKDEEQEKKKDKKTKKSKQNKKKLPEKICSIESLDARDRLPIIDDSEVVKGLLDNIICEIIKTFPEPVIARPDLYKRAERVLLKSDKTYLENLTYLVKHDEDYDNVDSFFRQHPEPDTPLITLEEELEITSNFETLPDGAWIIFGGQLLEHTNDELSKLRGLLSSIVSAALTTKYKISTWSSKLVDYAIRANENFGKDFQTYQYALKAFLDNRIPKLAIGDRTFKVNVLKIIKSDQQKPLRQVLLESLLDFNRLIIICQRFCCLLVKRYNFLYMFMGFPNNAVGYRKCNSGPASLLRFIELDALIRRIEFACNPQGCDITNFVVIPVKISDTTPEPKGRYRQWPDTVQNQMYQKAFEDNQREEESKRMKLKFLEEELEKESQRVEEFDKYKETKIQERKEKLARLKQICYNPPKTRKMGGEDIYDYSNTELQGSTYNSTESTLRYERQTAGQDLQSEPAEEEECTVTPKHGFGTEIPKARDECLRPRPVLYGYRKREKDLLYKIQGSKALKDRTICEMDKIKSCLIASTFAILAAILKPLNKWTSQRIDQVIDSSLKFSDTIEDMSSSDERVLKNLAIDNYKFDVWIKGFEPLGLVGNLSKQLERLTSLRKYIILKTANISYAICRDKYYHLFDAYSSMELTNSNAEEELKQEAEEEAGKKKQKYPKDIKLYGERNTASWILFADCDSMVKYMHDRACSPEWPANAELSFHVVGITSYKKSSQNQFVLQILTDMDRCHTSEEKENSICAHNESTDWLDHCLPMWSRLNKRNSSGRYRGMAVSKLKKYDIEIDKRLWSLWGSLHAQAPVFESTSRGKQYLACCVMALCTARLYRLADWSSQLLDSIIINGDRYFQQSIQNIECKDYQLFLEDLNRECDLDKVPFNIHVEPVAYGKLYSRPYYNRMNLAEGLMYFFKHFQFGILQCFRKCLAIGYVSGHDGGYFMFDCQSRDHPLFPKDQGASYVLRTKYLQLLLYCIVVTLNVPYYNVEFTLHKVDMLFKDQSVEDDQNPGKSQKGPVKKRR